MLATWVEGLRRRDASIVDPVWGPAFVLVALAAALAGEDDAELRWLLLGLTAAWGLRLGWHLVRRKLREPEEDRRYAAMRAPLTAFRLVVALDGLRAPGALVLIVSLPIQVAATRAAELGTEAIPGVVVFLLGLAFETIGDRLARVQVRSNEPRPGDESRALALRAIPTTSATSRSGGASGSSP